MDLRRALKDEKVPAETVLLGGDQIYYMTKVWIIYGESTN